MSRPFAVVTGASSGIGLELAAICAQEGFDLLVAADRSEIQTVADRFRGLGADVTVVETDLATTTGVDRLGAAGAGFIDSFSFALRAELKETGVTVTCLMPGATETDFFERADMLDTRVGQDAKDDPWRTAARGFVA